MAEKIWFISDLHFGHKNIIQYCGRPFSSVKEMEEKLVENWNRRVKKFDRVFCLGDFALCGKEKIIDLGRQLNGRKILILGNHDGASLNTYYAAGFEMVSKFPILWEGRFLLSHEPINDCPYINIHGHIHDKRIEDCSDTYWGVIEHYINVSVDAINYEPIEFRELEQKISEK